MWYSESEARKTIIKAGKKLCRLGLAERTWGNISARINDEYFVITPSGRAYDSLSENDLARVKICDLSCEDGIVPSSEKGVHAAIYSLRSDVGFIIHTHQVAATVCSIRGKALDTSKNAVLGCCVPCADYALPSTSELVQNVYSAVERMEGCRAALMKHHGAVCFGKGCDECFEIALELERICSDTLARIPVTLQLAPHLGESMRMDGHFVWKAGDENIYYNINDVCSDAFVELHRAIYSASDVRYITHAATSAAVNISARNNILEPYVDDFAMIAGENVLSAESADEVGKAIASRSAVLIRGMGALCFGRDEADARATAAILEKNCLCALYAKELEGCEPISAEHARHLRNVYLNSYSKRKDS